MAQLKDSLITGDLRVTGTIYGLMNGNAATATKLGTTNVGSTGLPIYLLDGAPTTITDLALSSGSIWAGTDNDTAAERQVGVRSGAGSLYLYSQSSTNGSRGLYVPAHGSGTAKGIISIDTNNNATFTGALSGNATTATSAGKLSTARNLAVALGSTTAVTFDGSANQNNIPVSGTLGIDHGGTGKTTAAEAWTALGGGALGKKNSLSADDIPELGAGKITSGTFSTDRIPNLAASKITSGTFSADRIPSLDAGKITTGTFAAGRIPTLSITDKTSGTLTVARGGTGATTVDGAQTNLGIPKIHYGTTTPAASLGKVGDLYVLYTA